MINICCRTNSIYAHYFYIALLLITLIWLSFSANSSEIKAWTESSSLPRSVSNHSSFEKFGFIFTIGGSTIEDFSTIYRSFILPNHSLSIWENVSDLPYDSYFHAVAVWKDYVYVVGGTQNPPVNSINYVYFSKIDPTGNLSSWTRLANYPIPISQHAITISGNHIYVSGGFTQVSGGPEIYTNKVYFTEIHPDGTIDNWLPTTNLPTTLFAHGMVEHNGYIYVLGGNESRYNVTKSVLRAEVNETGDLGPWIDMLSLPEIMNNAAFEKSGARIFTIGGNNGYANLSSVYYADLNVEDEIDQWENGPSLFESNCCGSANVVGSYLYLIGGYARDYTNKVNYDSIKLGEMGDLIVIVPGMGASWNYSAIVHGEDADNKYWTLMPFSDLYDGLIGAFENAGYQKGQDLFVYPYDWRRNISENGGDLCKFIGDLVKDKPDTKVKIVGHSMGGLVARSCLQSPGGENIGQLVTVGSPHAGASMAYKVWEGTDFSGMDDNLEKAIKLLSIIWRKKFDSKTQTLRAEVPSVQNLLPTYDFLIRSDQNFPVSKMEWKNNFLPNIEPSLPDALGRITTYAGDKIDTDRYYRVINRGLDDMILNRWEDGKPVKTENGSGDGTVLLESATLTNVAHISTLNDTTHNELVSLSSSNEKILNLLGIYSNGVDSHPPAWNQTIMATVASPVNWKIVGPNNQTYDPEDGLVMIDNAPDGPYKVVLTANDTGDYMVYFGRLLGEDEAWEIYEGTATYSGQVMEVVYPVEFALSSLGAKPMDNAYGRIDRLFGLFGDNRTLRNSLEVIREFLDKLNTERDRPVGIVNALFEHIDVLVSKIDKAETISEKANEQLRLLKADVEQELGDRGVW